MQLHALAPLRHDCSSCGACCNNVRVRFVDTDEQRRVAQFAADLGLVGAVDSERIVHQDGNCPFQEDGWKCRIHAAYGLQAKPLMCQTFPQVLRQTEAGLRAGVDPCSRAFQNTRDTGTELRPEDARALTVALDPDRARAEDVLLQALGVPDAQLGAFIAMVCGQRGHAGPAVPIGFAERTVALLKRSPLSELVAEAQCGPHNRRALTPVVDWLANAEPGALPPLLLSEADDQYARDCLRATLFLRLYLPSFPDAYTATLITTMGLVACAYATDDADAYGAAVCAWLRLNRARYFWMRLVPDPSMLAWVTTGHAETA